MWTILMLAVMVVLVENSIAEPYPRHHHHHHHRHPYLAVGTLAFAGGYIAGRRHHNGGGCYNCGCGGCGGSCGWCGGSYYGRRRRRDIEDFVSDPQIIETYAKIASQDKDQCGLRLVCELAQKDPRNLVEDEIQILLPYRGAGESDDTIYGDYDEAAWHGQEGHPCPTNYPLCAFTAQQVMTEYRKYATTSNNAPHQT
ncbi:uncharacterized protein LOC121875686 [Homarus americanus]|uniref:Putative DM4/DM12 family-like protein 10 n=1 Tax=Homarus americanus TaxID=6706 RepID=A0A8J5MRP9_HOMAM|nr:uncharacterized protein LOC121875686 [Homarus americanus]KAG7160927.1 putative DM4/DM12 family-like protein 10 [Homarus americanus]